MRRPVITLLAGALTSMSLTLAPAIAHHASTAAGETNLPQASAPISPGLHCETFDANGAPLELCDHGADQVTGLPPAPAPSTVAPAESLDPQATAGINCYGDGVSGMRVQAVYATLAGVTPAAPLATRLSQIGGYAAQVEDEVSQSAQQTGGERHVRWVTNASCDLDVLQVALPTSAVAATNGSQAAFSATVSDMIAKGHVRTDRLYMLWVEAAPDDRGLCGIGNVYTDDRASSHNANAYGPRYSRVDTWCFGVAETHELGHSIGAVQPTAKNSTPGRHCTDEYDLMCYDDARDGSVTMNYTNSLPGGSCQGSGDTAPPPPAPAVKGTGNDRRWDCNHDDYFSTNPTGANYLVTHWNTANHPVLAQTGSTGAGGAGAYHSLTRPVRIVDTRLAPPGQIWGMAGATYLPTYPAAITNRPARLTGKRSYVSKLTGFDVDGTGLTFPQSPLVSDAGVPNVGVSAVVLNVTVVDPSSAGFLSIRPYDPATFGSTPTISNINYVAGQVIANTVTITVPAHGIVEVYSSAGAPYVIFDVAGWFADASGTFIEKGAYHALNPTRIMNTRTGLGGSPTLKPNTTVDLTVTGGGVDATHAAAVVLNVTAAETTASSYFTVWPKGETRPTASNVNFPPAAAAANLVVVGVGTDGKISIYLEAGTANVIVDLLGWFDGGGPGAPVGAIYRAITPARLVDTRGGDGPKLNAGDTRTFTLRGVAGIPDAAAVTAVIGNVAAVAPTGGGYFTLFPTGGTQPDTSTVNFVPGQDRANLSFITLSSSGQSSLFDFGAPVHALIDIAGYFSTG